MLGLIKTAPKSEIKESIEVEVFKKAKSLIKKGWCQRAFVKKGLFRVRYCVVSAIGHATSNYDGQYFRIFINSNDLSSYGNSDQVIWQWNDQRGRTKKEVLKAFDNAIDYARSMK